MTTQNQSKKLLGALTKQGESLAISMLDADSKANVSKRDALLSIASNYYEKAKYEILLSAYHDTLLAKGISTNTAKVRKSEALQVIKACNLTELTGDNLKALQAFEGDYNALISQCRKIIEADNAKAGKVKNPPNRKAKDKLTDKQFESVIESVAETDDNQAIAVINEVSKQVNAKASNPQIAGLKQLILISNIANNAIANDTLEAPIVETFKDILALSEAQIVAIEKAIKATNEALATPYEAVTE